MADDKILVLVKGAGDLGTGVAWRLFKYGLGVVMTETARPMVVRRKVSFAQAVYDGKMTVEGIEAVLVNDAAGALRTVSEKKVPVLIDPLASCIEKLKPVVVVDAIMAKRNTGTRISDAPLVIGLGPGFTAGVDVHVVIETCRGHNLGRVIKKGCAAPDTGVPGEVAGYTAERLLRAPATGVLLACRPIGELVNRGEIIAFVNDVPVVAKIKGLLRGMARSGIWVTKGTKIGDIDPRGMAVDYSTISDKALAVAGGVAEAVWEFLFQNGYLKYVL